MRGRRALVAAVLATAATSVARRGLRKPRVVAYPPGPDAITDDIAQGVAIELDGDTGTGEQPLCFVDQTNHHMRIGWYTDTYRRTEHGWRLRTRAMTFLRRSGERDSGEPHDPTRPEPTTTAG